MDTQDTPHLREKCRKTRSTLTPTQFHLLSADAAIVSSSCSNIRLPIWYTTEPANHIKSASLNLPILTRTAPFKPHIHKHHVLLQAHRLLRSRLCDPCRRHSDAPRAATPPPARRPTSATQAPCSAATASSRPTPPPRRSSSRSLASLCKTSPALVGITCSPHHRRRCLGHILVCIFLAATYPCRSPDFAFYP